MRPPNSLDTTRIGAGASSVQAQIVVSPPMIGAALRVVAPRHTLASNRVRTPTVRGTRPNFFPAPRAPDQSAQRASVTAGQYIGSNTRSEARVGRVAMTSFDAVGPTAFADENEAPQHEAGGGSRNWSRADHSKKPLTPYAVKSIPQVRYFT